MEALHVLFTTPAGWSLMILAFMIGMAAFLIRLFIRRSRGGE